MLRWQKALRRVVSEVPGFLNPAAASDFEHWWVSACDDLVEKASTQLLNGAKHFKVSVVDKETLFSMIAEVGQITKASLS